MLRHADPSDAGAILLASHRNEHFRFGLAASHAHFQAAQQCLIHLHPTAQTVPPRAHHGATELVQPTPSRLVTAQPQNPL